MAGAELPPSGFSVDPTTGRVTLARAPASGAAVTAGFLFDVPVRFATDRLEIDHQAVLAGIVADIPILELRR